MGRGYPKWLARLARGDRHLDPCCCATSRSDCRTTGTATPLGKRAKRFRNYLYTNLWYKGLRYAKICWEIGL